MTAPGTVGYQSYLYSGAADAVPVAITTKVAKVQDISGPDLGGDDIDFTNMDSASGFMEFMPGLVDGGEVSITLVFTKAETALLYGYLRTLKAYMVTFSDGSTWHFNGYIKSLGNEAPAKGGIMQTATFKVAAKPTFTAVV